MTAGAAQIALKSSAIVPCGPHRDRRLRAAALSPGRPARRCRRRDRRRPRHHAAAQLAAALAALPDFLRSPYLAKGLKLMAKARRSLRFVSGVTSLAAEGSDRVSSVRFERGSTSKSIACDTLLLHQGVIPSVNLSNAAGCAHDFDPVQHCWVPQLDDWFASSVPRHRDRRRRRRHRRGRERGPARRDRSARRKPGGSAASPSRARPPGCADPRRAGRTLRGRRFLDLLYKPAAQFLAPIVDDTIICRCEEVTAGQVRDAAKRLGVTGPNQMKAFLRCGMGPCQGRLCGPTVVELIAEERGTTPAEVGYYRLRPPVKPVTLAELASLPQSEAAVKAVVR
jgi:bacterioferritin-associated ferredoxin